MKRFLFLVFIFIFSTKVVFAQMEGDLSMSPGVIDESAAPRAMLKYSINLKNNTNHKLNIYPLLEDLKKDETKNTDNLLARQYVMSKWISIKRGSVEIMPNSEIDLPLKIDIVSDAIPNDYFMSITFAHGSNRGEAEENAIKMSPPKLFINLKVEDQTVEKASILRYYPLKKFFVDPIPKLAIDFNNSGNVDLIPEGNILIYNKKNQEVDSIDINPKQETADATKIITFKAIGNNKLKTGKYKARLLINYGSKTSKEVQDTVYFIVITLPFLLFFGIGILIFIILLSMLIFRKTYHHSSPKSSNNNQQRIVVKKETGNGELINLKNK